MFEDGVVKEDLITHIEFTCAGGWSFTLPSILTEELGEMFSIEVKLGDAYKVILYNAADRIFTVKDPIDGIYFISVTLYNKYDAASLYGMIVTIDCPIPPEPEIPSYKYIF